RSGGWDRSRKPVTHRVETEIGQHQQRDREPADQHEVADRSEALQQPVMRAFMGRSETAYALDGGAVLHRPHLHSSSAQKAAVRTTPSTGLRTENVLLMVSS